MRQAQTLAEALPCLDITHGLPGTPPDWWALSAEAQCAIVRVHCQALSAADGVTGVEAFCAPLCTHTLPAFRMAAARMLGGCDACDSEAFNSLVNDRSLLVRLPALLALAEGLVQTPRTSMRRSLRNLAEALKPGWTYGPPTAPARCAPHAARCIEGFMALPTGHPTPRRALRILRKLSGVDDWVRDWFTTHLGDMGALVGLQLFGSRVQSSQYNDRVRAAWGLGNIQDSQSIAMLGEMAADDSAYTRGRVAVALQWHDSAEAAELLQRLLTDGDADVRRYAMESLILSRSSDAAPALEQAVRADPALLDKVGFLITDFFCWVGPRAVYQARFNLFRDLAHDPAFPARRQAIRLLGCCEGFEDLCVLGRNPEPDLRRLALATLHFAAEPAHWRSLAEVCLQDPDPTVQRLAARMLGEQQGSPKRDALVAEAYAPQQFFYNDALSSLARLGDPRALERLVSGAQAGEAPSLQDITVLDMGGIAAADAASMLFAATPNNPHPDVLGHWGDARHIPTLLAMQPRAPGSVTESLARMGTPEARAALVALLPTLDGELRDQVTEALNLPYAMGRSLQELWRAFVC